MAAPPIVRRPADDKDDDDGGESIKVFADRVADSERVLIVVVGGSGVS